MVNQLLTWFYALFLRKLKIGHTMIRHSISLSVFLFCIELHAISQEFRQSSLKENGKNNTSSNIAKSAEKDNNQPDFSGQWKGEFTDKSDPNFKFSSDKCEYVVELEINNNKVIGSTYTYFTENGKRYYTICRLEGRIKSNQKYIEIEETERTKTNIPLDVNNCLQIHKLTYYKKGNIETLEGNWIPVPKQAGDCGFGTTKLIRRSLVNSFPWINVKTDKNKENPKTTDKSVAKNPNKDNSTKYQPDIKEQSTEITNASKENNSIPDVTGDDPLKKDDPITGDISKLEKRKNKVLKTIEVESNLINIDLYDNGEIDGDSVSLFYNNKLLFSNKKLSTKAIHLSLDIDNPTEVNELVMYAENLGSIPPNTALMIVTDGPNRYEVRITSDLEKSGVIRFIHKPNSPKN